VYEPDGPSTDGGRRPVPRPGGPRRRPRPNYDPPADTVGELLQRLWVVGPLSVVVVIVLVLATGPGDISILRRLFIWFSTFVFSLWLLRDHRRRVPVAQRRLIFLVCGASLIVLFLVLTITAL
jgi:hypothetical protein